MPAKKEENGKKWSGKGLPQEGDLVTYLGEEGNETYEVRHVDPVNRTLSLYHKGKKAMIVGVTLDQVK